jgi:hypothetical protein
MEKLEERAERYEQKHRNERKKLGGWHKTSNKNCATAREQ